MRKTGPAASVTVVHRLSPSFLPTAVRKVQGLEVHTMQEGTPCLYCAHLRFPKCRLVHKCNFCYNATSFCFFSLLEAGRPGRDRHWAFIRWVSPGRTGTASVLKSLKH